MAKLSEQTPVNGLPPAIAYDVANAAARNALAPTAPSVGKLLLQRDIKRLFALVAAGPAEWIQLVEQAALDTLAGVVAGKADGSATTTALASKADATATTNALALKANLAFSKNTQTGTTFTLTVNAPLEWLEMTNAATNTVTVPPNASVALPLMQPVTIARHGAGVTIITAGAGVTLRPANTMYIDVQFGTATLIQVAVNEWYVQGQVAV